MKLRGASKTQFFCIASKSFIFLMVCIFFSSCSAQLDEKKYLSRLEKIDTYIQTNKIHKALHSLTQLEKKAYSTRHWLSIIKRYYQLNETQLALDAVTKGLEKQPASERLLAVQSYLLLQNNQLEKAFLLYNSLALGAYQNIAITTAISQELKTPCLDQNPEIWFHAWKVHNSIDYLRNALVASFNKNNTSRFLYYLNYFLDNDLNAHDRLFATTISLFLNVPEKAIAIAKNIKDIPLAQYLLADAYFLAYRVEDAIRLWKTIITDNTEYSPIVLYNLASLETDWKQKREYLYLGSTTFPNFYPLVALFVRNAQKLDISSPYSALEQELEKAGFETDSMIERKELMQIDVNQAIEVLENATNNISAESNDFNFNEDLIQFALEYIHILKIIGKSKDSINSYLWSLSEQFSDNPNFWRYFVYYNLVQNNYDLAYAYFLKHADFFDPLYQGVFYASKGDLENAKKAFHSYEGNNQNDWIAITNLAKIAHKEKEFVKAIEFYTMALNSIPSKKEASLIHYEIAQIIQENHNIEKAIQILYYALELDENNYQAEILRRKLEAGK